MTQLVDLNNCDREPIHIPGMIQPHGALLALDGELRVLQHSGNATAFLNVTFDDLIGRELKELLSAESIEMVSNRLLADDLTKHPVYVSTIKSLNGQASFDAIAHRTDQAIILEMEPADRVDPISARSSYQLLQSGLSACRDMRGVAELSQCIAEKIRRLNGFDRVMIYQFDDSWNGKVIAENKREDLEPFLGLHYPASDIPVQARQLYTKNWLRFIGDRDYVPCPIVPTLAPSSAKPLDMSFCVLRSVSPIHIEYLRNMGVGASMSVSLLKDGKLWGLVACHHYSPRFVPYEVRTACEHLGQVLSLRLVATEGSEIAAGIAHRDEQVLDIASGFQPLQLSQSLISRGEVLLALLEAGGVAVVDDRTISRVGQTPGAEDIELIISKLPPPGDEESASTDHVSDWVGQSRLDSIAAGVLALSLNRFSRKLILFFRPEVIQSVHWAGDPSKSVVKGEDGVRLSPRGSFALWKQNVQGRSLPWSKVDKVVARDLRRALAARAVSFAEEISQQNVTLQQATFEKETQLASEREARSQAERMNKLKDDFVATLSQELRTPLNAIIGWAHLLNRSGRLVGDETSGSDSNRPQCPRASAND